MKGRRKTVAEKEQEWIEAKSRAWDEFKPKLEALQTVLEAELLVYHAPAESSPGRCFYSNLGFFVGHHFSPPTGASSEEKSLYIQFVKRLDGQGALKPGAADRVIAALEQAISRQWW